VNGIGVFELQWDPSAPVGFVNSGNFVLSGEWWDGDPLNGGSFIADATDTALPYSAIVGAPASGVPEPSSFVLLASGFGLMAALWNARNRRSIKRAANLCDRDSHKIDADQFSPIPRTHTTN
jgi:hypothetical protein